MKQELLEPSQYYHFYNRGNNRDHIFIEKENYYYFLKLIKKYLIPILDIYSYCLLPNHFHLIVRIKEDENLPIKIQENKTKIHQPFSNLFNAYVKAFNKKHHRRGSLFQKHPKRIIIKNEEYLRNLIVYINTNSDHHGIADYYEYEHSSFQALISNKSTLLMRKEVIDLFEDVDNFKYIHKIKKIKIDFIDDLFLE